MALEAGVLQAIGEKTGRRVTAAALANQTGYDELLIGMVPQLRLCKDLILDLKHPITS